MKLRRDEWLVLQDNDNAELLEVKLSRGNDDYVVFSQSDDLVLVSITHLRRIVEGWDE